MAFKMIVPITEKHITGKNRPGIKIKKMKKIVVHWTANQGKGATALANRNFFENTEATSAQYCVDDIAVIEVMPSNEVAYAVGAKKYTAFGNSLREAGYGPNFFTTSIEMCVNKESSYHRVEMNTISLIVHLLFKYNLTVKDVVRHYDITGKMCPGYYITDKDWQEFLKKVEVLYNAAKSGAPQVIPYEIDDLMQVTTNAIIRKGPDFKYEEVGKYVAGDKVRVYDLTNGFYRTDKGWVASTLLKDIPDVPSITEINSSGLVTADSLNIRSTNSTSGSIVGKYPKGEIIIILEEKGNWFRTDKGWVHGSYVDQMDMRVVKSLSSAHVIFSDDDLTKKIGSVEAGVGVTIFGQYKKNGKTILAISTPKHKGFIGY